MGVLLGPQLSVSIISKLLADFIQVAGVMIGFRLHRNSNNGKIGARKTFS